MIIRSAFLRNPQPPSVLPAPPSGRDTTPNRCRRRPTTTAQRRSRDDRRPRPVRTALPRHAAASSRAPPAAPTTAATRCPRQHLSPRGPGQHPAAQTDPNVLFESQIDYEFVNGDISTFLRYKYYARNFTYRIGVFDSIGFPDIGSTATKEFERVRGGLLLFERAARLQQPLLLAAAGRPPHVRRRHASRQPQEQHLHEDRLPVRHAVRRADERDRRRDARPHHSRPHRLPRHRPAEDRPRRRDHAVGDESATGDYQYTKFEAEALRRFDITATSFIFSRLHVGIVPPRP